MKTRMLTVEQLPDAILRIKKGTSFIMSGKSGSGKDRINDLLGNFFFPLDSIGKRQGTKWVTDLDALHKSRGQVVGTSDNLEEVAIRMAEIWERPIIFIWIIPAPEIYRQANAAKALSATDVPKEWINEWLANSKKSDSTIYNSGIRSRTHIIKLMANHIVEFWQVANNRIDAPITKGWHQANTKVHHVKQISSHNDRFTIIRKMNDTSQHEQLSYKILPYSLNQAKSLYKWKKLESKEANFIVPAYLFADRPSFKEALYNPETNEYRLTWSFSRDKFAVLKLLPESLNVDTLLVPKLISFKVWRGSYELVKADWQTQINVTQDHRVSEAKKRADIFFKLLRQSRYL